jgi:hypothetical protein
MTWQQKEVGFPRSMFSTHTENARAFPPADVAWQHHARVSHADVGTAAACRANCAPALQRFAEQNGVFILYGWPGPQGAQRFQLFGPLGE